MSYKNFLSKYKNPVEYDNTFTGCSGKELDFYKSHIEKSKKVLYFGSGTGRLLKKFLLVNKNITAVEFSKEMVDYSRKFLQDTKILHQDVLELNLDEQFDLILAPYRFLTHFDKDELKRLFQVVDKHLVVGGYFVGDIFSPYLPHDRGVRCEIESVEVHTNIVEKVYNCYDHESQICVEIVEKTDTETGHISVIEMPWHYYYPEQLVKLAEKNNFCVKNFYGSFDKDPLDKNSYDLVFVMTKQKGGVA